MLGSRPRLAFALAVPFTLLAACVTSAPNGSSSGSGGTSSAGTPGGSGLTGDTTSGGTSNEMSGGPAGGSSGSDSSSGGDGGALSDPNESSYANVTAVTATGTAGSYTFNVTIESADIDCSQYADWWEVLTEDGSLVYRRILEHSHTDANGSSDLDAPGNTFTRSGGPVPVTESDVLVVRAHMSIGGYNGAVMRGSASAGFTQALDLTGDFATGVEQDEPQPDGCEF